MKFDVEYWQMRCQIIVFFFSLLMICLILPDEFNNVRLFYFLLLCYSLSAVLLIAKKLREHPDSQKIAFILVFFISITIKASNLSNDYFKYEFILVILGYYLFSLRARAIIVALTPFIAKLVYPITAFPKVGNFIKIVSLLGKPIDLFGVMIFSALSIELMNIKWDMGIIRDLENISIPIMNKLVDLWEKLDLPALDTTFIKRFLESIPYIDVLNHIDYHLLIRNSMTFLFLIILFILSMHISNYITKFFKNYFNKFYMYLCNMLGLYKYGTFTTDALFLLFLVYYICILLAPKCLFNNFINYIIFYFNIFYYRSCAKSSDHFGSEYRYYLCN